MAKLIKILLLFSGGLDSILAAKILQEQNVKIELLAFTSYFFNANQAKQSAKILRKRIKTIDISKEHFKIVRNPRYCYGRGLNPCLDCHLLMIKKAKQILKKEKFNLIATGEILGQRPMSQNKRQFQALEKNVGLKNKILRPLSARLLEPTIFEKENFIDRKKLLSISGRSRKPQIALAKKYKIKIFPSPAGGCILTDKIFSQRLKNLFDYKKRIDKNDIELLKVGRHFLINNVKIIVGRNHQENLRIKKLANRQDILMEIDKISGPTILIKIYNDRKINSEILRKAARLTKRYSSKAQKLNKVKIKYYTNKKISSDNFFILSS
ncbi:MAG: NFACT RNA binding domain-containing protein [Patescibacteria group bacterium]|nr:NFACT RNA binding domain-containing protein [Patescibacteria group bacterium]